MAGKKRNKGPRVYAVRVGRNTGITGTWPKCDEWTKSYKRNQFKSFKTIKEAEYFLKWGDIMFPEKWYAVIKGRDPGVYTSRPQAQLQVMAWRGHGRGFVRSFNQFQQAREEVAKMKAIDSSQVPVYRCHFGRFVVDAFEPDLRQPFSEQFNKLAASQGWAEGSEEYDRQKIEAILEEFDLQVLATVPGFKVEEDASDEKLNVDESNKRSMERRMEIWRYLCMRLKEREPDPALR